MKKQRLFIFFIIFFASGWIVAQESLSNLIDSYKKGAYNVCIEKGKIFVKNTNNTNEIPSALFLIGISFYKINETNKAIKLFKYHNTKYPDYKKNDMILYFLGELYKKQGNFAQSKKILNQLINKYPSSAYFNKAQNILKDINKESDYTGLINDLVENEDSKQTITNTDRFFINGQYEQFLRACQNDSVASRNIDEVLQRYFIISISYYRLGQYSQSKRFLDYIIKQRRQYPYLGETYLLRAWVAYKMNLYHSANEDVSVVLSLYSDKGYSNKARLLLKKLKKLGVK